MLHIDLKIIEKKYSSRNSVKGNISDPYPYTCIGYGQAPDTGVNYIVGTFYDPQQNKTSIFTHLLKDVDFEGDLLA